MEYIGFKKDQQRTMPFCDSFHFSPKVKDMPHFLSGFVTLDRLCSWVVTGWQLSPAGMQLKIYLHHLSKASHKSLADDVFRDFMQQARLNLIALLRNAAINALH